MGKTVSSRECRQHGQSQPAHSKVVSNKQDQARNQKSNSKHKPPGFFQQKSSKIHKITSGKTSRTKNHEKSNPRLSGNRHFRHNLLRAKRWFSHLLCAIRFIIPLLSSVSYRRGKERAQNGKETRRAASG